MKRVNVFFRKFPEGDTIAIFPDEMADLNGNVMSYQKIGQHGACSPELLKELDIPSYEDALLLFKELEKCGYDNLKDCTFSIEKRVSK